MNSCNYCDCSDSERIDAIDHGGHSIEGEMVPSDPGHMLGLTNRARHCFRNQSNLRSGRLNNDDEHLERLRLRSRILHRCHILVDY